MRHLMLLLFLLCAACAGTPPQTQKVASRDTMTCTMEPVVGSHLRQKLCASEAQREALRARARATMQKRTLRGGATPADPAGN